MLATLRYQRNNDVEWQDGGLKPLAAEDLPHVVIYSTGRLEDWRKVLYEQPDSQQEATAMRPTVASSPTLLNGRDTMLN